MQDKTDQTVETYRKNFKKYVERTVGEVFGDFKSFIDDFLKEIAPGGEIFEMGSTHSRDARYMVDKGYKVFCTDIIPEALRELSAQGFQTAEYDFRDKPAEEWRGRFDGFFANGVLHHASQEMFEQILYNILEMLKPGGAVAFSVKRGTGEEVSTGKMDSPRFFKYYSPEEMRSILEEYPFEILALRLADEERWLHVICRKK